MAPYKLSNVSPFVYQKKVNNAETQSGWDLRLFTLCRYFAFSKFSGKAVKKYMFFDLFGSAKEIEKHQADQPSGKPIREANLYHEGRSARRFSMYLASPTLKQYSY